ncbi:multidrug effflux MFS transporter [Actibacterium pelagium]|uniref:MFS transporter n=1 Tax=Actibacterium pelagium TaxID=2029103 RepID=A0A917AEK1_9RHOB|nr:multidrug effflux MFS transporter [Actibacterium pelagium]GGE42816.1 MFS transporter [Actibacterium pelagium]
MTKPFIGRTEFIALTAMLFATIAFSVDAMLPALPEIGQALSPEDINRAQLVITSFVLGMGVGTFIVGPLTDAFGRRSVALVSIGLFIFGSVIGGLAQSLEMLLLARFIQGAGAAGPRVVCVAIVRDLYEGRQMASIMSFVMMVFTLVPAMAPTLGAAIISVSGWRMIFVSFMVFALVSAIWFAMRMAETHPKEARRPISSRNLWSAVKEVFAAPMTRLSIIAQTMCMGALFATISSTQQIIDTTYGQGEHFHLWFGLVALMVAPVNLINARLVLRLGMRRMVTFAVLLQVVMSLISILILLAGGLGHPLGFAHYIIWKITIFAMVGLTLGNLTALAMEPLGHIAGLAGSVIGAVSTVLSVLIAVPVGLAYNGTALPLAIGVFLCALIALVTVRRMAKLERVVVRPGDV